MIKVKDIIVNKYSSDYGDSNSCFGQPLGVKSIVIISVKSYSGIIRSHELYAGIYLPDLIESLVKQISGLYLDQEFDYSTLLIKNKGIPFISNTGLFKSIKGAIESCILQLFFVESNISLVDGLRDLLNKDVQRIECSTPIKYYASGGSVAFSPKECIDDLNRSLDMGFQGFKMRCGYQSLSNDLKRVSSINSEITKFCKDTNDFSLMIDFIQGTLNPKQSVERLKEYINYFDKFDVLWYEEPLDPDDASLYKKLSKIVRERLSLGESFTAINEYICFSELLNIFQIDVTHLGGYTEAIKVLNYFSENKNEKTLFTSHVWGSELSLLLNLALCKACSLIGWFEIPLLRLEINNHLFNSKTFDFKTINNSDIDMLLSELNLNKDSKYEFIPGSGYKI